MTAPPGNPSLGPDPEPNSDPTPPEPWTPHGRALLDYLAGDHGAAVVVHGVDAEPESVPAATFFRDAGAPEALEPWERIALAACRGRVLDVGAAAGATALELQRRGHAVVALDISPECVAVMQQRGVVAARLATLCDVDDGPYDTVLFLMHGIGVVGDLGGLRWTLADLHRLVARDGQILLDSRAPDAGPSATGSQTDHGVARLWMEYRGVRGAAFCWLFVDPETLATEAAAVGWQCEWLWEDRAGRYVARLLRRSAVQERV